MHRDGDTYYKKNGKVKKTFTKIAIDSKKQSGNFKINDSNFSMEDLEGFSGEAWYQSAYLRWCELRIFEDAGIILPEYLRVCLEKVNFFSEENDRIISCYPILKIYETGILSLEFRVIAPERIIELDEFINKFINVFEDEFDEVCVPPAISKYASISHCYFKNSFMWKLYSNLMKKSHFKNVDKLTEIEEDSYFIFKLAPLASNGKESLKTVAHTIFDIIDYVDSISRKGKIKKNKIGNYWSGRPNIHLIDFENQKKTARENEKTFNEEFKRMLARVSGNVENNLKLPEDLRVFDDYNGYITSASTLWVTSSGLKDEDTPYKDVNRGHLIYENQIKVELLDYVYMLYRSLFDKSGLERNSDEILSLKEKIIELDYSLKVASHYGEIRDLLNRSLKEMGLPELKEGIDKKLDLKKEKSLLSEGRKNNKLAMTVSILFGGLAIPQLVESVFKPLWKIYNWWLPDNKEVAELFLLFVGMIIVFLILIISRSIVKKIDESI